jgi:hypothetical protein
MGLTPHEHEKGWMMTTETLDRPAAIAEELARVEQELEANDAALTEAFKVSRVAMLAEWRGDEGAETRRQELDTRVADLRAERERLEGVRDDLGAEREEAVHAARLKKFDAERDELLAACEEAGEAAKAVDRELKRLVGAVERWDEFDTLRISLAGRLGLNTTSFMRSGRALQAFLAFRLTPYVRDHVEPVWRREFRNDGWSDVDATFTRVAQQDAERARKKLA